MNMACIEGDKLKNEVLDKIEEYLNAEQAQYTSSNFDEEASRFRAELAHASLAETRRRYWQHIRLHKCDTAAIMSVEPTTLNSIAV
jgi:hypothetical protein